MGEAADILTAAARITAVCTFDRARLSAWIALHATLSAQAGAGKPADDVTVLTARLWQRLLAGETAGLDAAAKALLDDASRLGAGAEVIETSVIRALVALSAGAMDDAVELGRRAARMAQAEGLAQHEYLANITLARIRRYSGRPHLALHILATLQRVAPRTWSGWIGWETLLAGGRSRPARASGEPDTALVPSETAERSLSELLGAAASGERGVFVAAVATLERAAAAWPHLAQEVAALLTALDPSRPVIPDSMAAWCRGDTASVPFGLYGVGIPQDAETQIEVTAAYVVAQPGQRGRRFLFPGLPLTPRARLLVRDSVRSGTRTETGLAALALAGEAGMTRDAFFRSVYGFPFVAHRHRAVLDVLCHRMRNLVGDAGEILRDGGAGGAGGATIATTMASTAAENTGPADVGPSLALVLREPIVVPDMRCVLPTANRVLRALATLGATSASVAADCLRMPLRTVQAVLQQLVGEGACTVERDGRRIAYRIEDTTFTGVNAV